MNSLGPPAEIQIAKTLAAGHAITVRWDCGDDESFVQTQLDGQDIEADYSDADDLANLLGEYIAERLDLPGVGEFSMQGTGRIFVEAGEVVIEYQSEAFTDASWMEDMSDEELADMNLTRPEPPQIDKYNPEAWPGYSLDKDMSEDYTGREVLFQL